MRFRKLRMAFSVGCGIVCVLLIMLWVRSYWRLDLINRNSNSNSSTVRADAGLITLSHSQGRSPLLDDNGWKYIADNASWGMQYWQFDWAWNTRIILVRIPIWVLALAVAMLARAPWIRWSKRFTIRTLLIATTLVALVLGIIVSFQ